MTQKLRYFCTLLLMAVVGVAWADTGTITFSTNGVKINGANVTGDDNLGNTWTITTVGTTSFTTNAAYYQVGSSSKPASSITFTTTLSEDVNIESMSAKFGGFNGTAGTITLKVGETEIGTGSLNAANDVTVNSNSTAVGKVLTITVTGISKGVKVYNISYTYSAASGDTPSISASNVNIAYDETGGVIAYTIENEVEGGSVNATTDADWISFDPSFNSPIAFSCEANEGGERTATVTLTYSYGDNENVTKNVTVTQAGNPNRPGTKNNPYTVAQAREAIDNNTDITGVYAMGVVSEIVTPLNTQYGNITYNISADGTTTADQLQAYRGKSYEGDNFTSEDDIKVGDEVVVYGNLKKYNDTYEFDANNQLVSLNRPVSEDPAVTLDDYTIDVPVEGDTGILTVQYQNIDDVAADVQFYDENGNEVDANYYEVWLTASLDEDNNVNYIAIENYGEARTAYFKVFALVGNDYVYSDMITITQAAYVAPSIATLPFEFNGGRAAIEETDGLTQEGLGSDYASEPKLKFENKNGQISSLLLQFDEEPGKLSFDIKGNNFSGGTFTVQTSEDGVTFTDLASYTELGATQNEEFKNLDANVRFIKWIYTNKSSGNVGLGNIKLEKPATSATITIKDGFKATTFSCDKALDFTGQNIAAYIITDENGATAQVTKVPANTGLYIERGDTEGTISYDIPFLTNEADAEKITGNLLVGTISEPVNTKTLEGNYTYYLFGKQNGKEAFFKVGENTSDAKATASAGKAYLAVPGAGNAKEMIVISGDVTGIESIENGTIVNDNYYTIDGKLVKGQPTQKGIYVVNGRKVVIK